MKKLVAFDIGSSWAYAHNLLGEPVAKLMVTEGVRPHRLMQFRRQLRILIIEWRASKLVPDGIIFERPFCRGRAATRSLWGQAGVLEEVMSDAGFAIMDQEPHTIKKFATGSGNAKKPEMIAAAQRLGYKGDNEHEADAFCLLKYAEANAQ